MIEQKLPAIEENLDTVKMLINRQLTDARCPKEAMRQIDIAAEELFINISRYAYPQQNQGEVVVRLLISDSPRAVEISFSDWGIPYDPLSRDNPDVTLAMEEREPGGLGLYLVKHFMDDVQYRYHNGQNEITIKKYI